MAGAVVSTVMLLQSAAHGIHAAFSPSQRRMAQPPPAQPLAQICQCRFAGAGSLDSRLGRWHGYGAKLTGRWLDSEDGAVNAPSVRTGQLCPATDYAAWRPCAVFDRHNRRIMLVNWDGTGLRAVRTGLALAVWADDAGREWIYYGEESGMQRLVPEVYRCLADNPTTVEPVWERTAVGLNNFQLSGDARRAGGVFPWPECGIAELPGRGLRIYGKGCYPALAPDDSGLFWIFDGAHRNLLFFRADTDERWRVPINTAPEIDGYEVYYPRWSNRARFMVMTGPFKVGTGDNRIRGGGLEVEVYAGRFSADYRRVEGGDVAAQSWRFLSRSLGGARSGNIAPAAQRKGCASHASGIC